MGKELTNISIEARQNEIRKIGNNFIETLAQDGRMRTALGLGGHFSGRGFITKWKAIAADGQGIVSKLALRVGLYVVLKRGDGYGSFLFLYLII